MFDIDININILLNTNISFMHFKFDKTVEHTTIVFQLNFFNDYKSLVCKEKCQNCLCTANLTNLWKKLDYCYNTNQRQKIFK